MLTRLAMMDRLRVLLIAYAFPPVGGAGVQRAVKLVKYLPDWGIDAAVLTVENPSVPLTDSSFDKDIAGVTVHRARTLEPGYGVKRAGWKASVKGVGSTSIKARLLRAGMALARQLLVPDPQLLWFPGAGLKLAQIAADYDVVVITAPPFSQFLLGPLATLRGVPLVLDYRDEWSTLRGSYEMLQGGLAAAVGAPLERVLLRACDSVVTATPAFRRNILRTYSFLSPQRVHAISNGYDPDDFPAALPAPPTNRFVISYAGTVYRLTSARTLLGAVRQLHATKPQLAKLLEVRFMGRIVDTELDAFEGTDALGVRRLGYVPHDEVLALLGNSHMVMCMQADAPGVEHIYPGKVFELMKLGRPILTISPAGALTRLVQQLKLGVIFDPHDQDGLCRFLTLQLIDF
ncbi:MAG TPA: hypothetical protein ENK23_04225, partial [Sorangium sp.]|nr:hypothetical protein [Sorangium sp.]